MLLWIFVFALSSAMIFLQAQKASVDQFLTPQQMVSSGRVVGVPFAAHSGMWSDLILFGPLMATIIAAHGREWKWWQVLVMIIAGVLLSMLMHDSYRKLPHPEAHVHNGKLTAAGEVHLYYMAGGFAIIGLFYFFTPALGVKEVAVVSLLLFVHVIFGLHVPMKIARPRWFPYYMDIGTIGALAGSGITLILLSIFALWRE